LENKYGGGGARFERLKKRQHAYVYKIDKESSRPIIGKNSARAREMLFG